MIPTSVFNFLFPPKIDDWDCPWWQEYNCLIDKTPCIGYSNCVKFNKVVRI